MAGHLGSPSSYSLDPTAPAFSMPPQTGAPDNSVNGSIKPQKPTKKPERDQNKPSEPSNVTHPSIATNLSGAELKRQKLAEKAARRAEKVAERGAQALQTPSTQAPAAKSHVPRRPSIPKKDGEPMHRRTGSSSGRQMPLRPAPPEAKEKSSEEKRVGMFNHLYSRERKASIVGTAKDVHPAVLALGLQIRDYVLCGGNARCVATLLVFKKVIRAYDTPPGMALSRHLTQHLSHQIAFLSKSRPLSISQGNSIRWLKKLISTMDPDLTDIESKDFLCTSIDSFIREKVTLADELIQKEATTRIVDGDVILTYAKSSIVEKSLLDAQKQGKKFKVIVVDSRPLFEGKNLARSLTDAGIAIEYCLLSGLTNTVIGATKCFLGASAMMGNGRLYSRAGTAMVAMMAKEIGAHIPVIVLCESIKFTNRVGLDSVMLNELGDADSLIEVNQPDTFATKPKLPAPAAQKGAKKGKDEDPREEKRKKGLEGWRDHQNLHLLSLMYDITPTKYLDMVITEMGCMPPSATPVVNAVNGDDD